MEPKSLDLSPFQPRVYRDTSSSSSHPLFSALGAQEAQSWGCPRRCSRSGRAKVRSTRPVLSLPPLFSVCPRSPFSGVESGADILLLASATRSLLLSCARLFSLHLCKRASKATSCHGDRKIAATLGMGAGPASRGAGRKSSAPIDAQGVPRLPAFSQPRAVPRGPRRSRGVCCCCICYHRHWEGGDEKKNVYAGLFPKSSPPSQIFGHLWGKRQFSGISRGPSGLH